MLVNTFRCVRFLLLLLLPPLLTSVSAAPVTPVSSGKPSGKTCINATIPITISARNALFNTAIPSSDTDVVNLISNLTRPGGNFSAQILAGYATVAGTYRISTQYCMPAGKPQPRPTIQVLTHGIGFDKTYWDLAFGNYKYSYVDYATSNGYHTLSYDRLGVGSSTIADPLHSVQAFLEVSVLAELTRLLRTGRFPSAPQAPLRYERVLHVGHSFGAILTSGLVNLAPELSDGIALTGYTASGMYLPYFVAGGNFQLASLNEPRPLARPPGYMIAGNMRASQYLFFLEGAYDPAILPYAERAKQTVTQGELLTIGGLAGENRYPGPVYVVTGDADLPFCGGNCSTPTTTPALVRDNFPQVDAADFDSLVVANVGHGINMHYNATAAWDGIGAFFRQRGLESR